MSKDYCEELANYIIDADIDYSSNARIRLADCIAEYLNINGYTLGDGRNWSPWSPDDVVTFLRRYLTKRPLTPDECEDIAERANAKADLGDGVSWDSLEYWVEQGLQELGIHFEYDRNWQEDDEDWEGE